MRRHLFVADVLAVTAIFAVVELSGAASGTASRWEHLAIVAMAALGLVSLLEAKGLYTQDDTAADRTTPDDFPAIVSSVTLIAFGLASLGWILGYGDALMAPAIWVWFGGVASLPIARGAARTVCRRREEYVQKTLVVGAGDIGQLVARKLRQHPEYGLDLVGFVDPAPKPLAGDLATVPVLGGTDDLGAIIDEHGVHRVVFSFSTESDERILKLARGLREKGVLVDIVPRLFDAVGHHAKLNVFEGLRVMSLPAVEPASIGLFAKRALDIAVAAIGLVAVAPLAIVIIVAMKLEDGGPILYRGKRIGQGGRLFDQLKFRSMRIHTLEDFERMLDVDPRLRAEFERTQKLVNDPRVTRVGAFLRKTSLDELPQFWNVLRGDLSLVGPRPITETELTERYLAFPEVTGYWDVPTLRPGLTGMWQINGRSVMSFEERIRIDTAYLQGWSFWLDVQILAKTPRILVTSRGAY